MCPGPQFIFYLITVEKISIYSSDEDGSYLDTRKAKKEDKTKTTKVLDSDEEGIGGEN